MIRCAGPMVDGGPEGRCYNDVEEELYAGEVWEPPQAIADSWWAGWEDGPGENVPLCADCGERRIVELVEAEGHLQAAIGRVDPEALAFLKSLGEAAMSGVPKGELFNRIRKRITRR